MSRTILIVDDSLVAREQLKAILYEAGLDTEEAGNGLDALHCINSSPPDLVILDVIMPEMDGIECCRLIKNDPRTREIPIIMVTSLCKDEDIKSAYAVGCDSYITKPIRKDVLLGKIWLLLNLIDETPSSFG